MARWGKPLPPFSVSGSDLSLQTISVSGHLTNMLTPKKASVQIRPPIW